MSGMERLKAILTATVAVCILAVPAGIFLANVHATQGWYVGVCVSLAGFGVWYALAPSRGEVRTRDCRAERCSSAHHSEERPKP